MTWDALLTIGIFISLWTFIKWGFREDESYENNDDNDKTEDRQ